MRMRNLVESLERKYKLNESYVDEWWGQTEEDPFEFAAEYNLECQKMGRQGDECLYRFMGSKEDINQARKDGYFYSIDNGEDEGHSEDLNEVLNEDESGKKYIVTTRGGFVGGNDLNGTLFDSKEEARAACNEWKNSFGKNRSYYKPQTSIYVYKPGGVFDDAKKYHDERIKNESKELTEDIEDDIYNKVVNFLRDKLDNEFITNIAQVVASEIPEYNLDWCKEDGGTTSYDMYAQKLVEALAEDLMYNFGE